MSGVIRFSDEMVVEISVTDAATVLVINGETVYDSSQESKKVDPDEKKEDEKEKPEPEEKEVKDGE